MASPKLDVSAYPRVALVLQGGGALGSYQAGVYEGLARAGIHPNWVAGISIGALNCAIIAGNPPEKRVERLHDFWETICMPPIIPTSIISGHKDLMAQLMSPWGDMLESMGHVMFNSMAAMSALVNGQEGFFKPRPMAPGGGAPDTTSFYDTTPMIATLERFADFDRINSGETRVSLGATNVASGNFVYFDSTEIKLTPKHFIASGSLPPGFPATEIDGEYYWDGGCVSNTPLEYVLGVTPRRDTLVFQVDLWSSAGSLPTDIFQVNERQKDIQYSSRTRTITNTVHMAQTMRRVLQDTVDRIPASVKAADPWFDSMLHRMMGARYNVIHLIYQNKTAEGHYKDYQFSAEAKNLHWQTGLHDMDETLRYPQCLELPQEGDNFVTFDVHTRKRSSSAQFRAENVVKAKASAAPAKNAPAKKTVKKVAVKKATQSSRPRRTP
ncbi:MAG: patatin-like phospholipase family protein [Burkholderiaceae bacterium]|nr:patatin-like phospholipase family protein [Burkholderiaceae bacterium]MCD8516835.1 patatin-like phospholipase family protein [Burkholderiaceae bacterium]MCD8538138.1 patatin-like phospholipase family protein [Burkholderiaceae bacterium]MCD8565438.1 patatin-like phospholipase family protein [Burkholderiaceae bacterium]